MKKYALILQHGDLLPRVTHHSDIVGAKMEFGLWISSNYHQSVSPVAIIHLDELPELEPDQVLSNPGTLAGLITLHEGEQWCYMAHVWSEDKEFNKVLSKAHATKESAIDHMCANIMHAEQKDMARDQGYMCFNADTEELGPVQVEHYVIDLFDACDSSF